MLAIIGGTGLSRLEFLEPDGRREVATPYSDKPVQVELFAFEGRSLAFLPRHGSDHAIPPHQVNYRANIWALREVGVSAIVAINAVGGIDERMAPGAFMIPDQLIDYTHSRPSTFFDGELEQVTHIDFTEPFSASVRELLVRATLQAIDSGEDARTVLSHGVYGVTQGPRLETAAEIRKLRTDGCDIVGMTAMPEAALARELDIPYGMLALSVNWAAGLVPGEITMEEISRVIEDGMTFVAQVIKYCTGEGKNGA